MTEDLPICILIFLLQAVLIRIRWLVQREDGIYYVYFHFISPFIAGIVADP